MKPAEGGIDTGSIVDGKYRIESILGRGGMGMVYRAFHLALEEDVAIKVLHPDAARDDEVVARFVREAQSAVKLKSEHVARIQDVGTFEDGLPFMVMEFLQGADLGQMVDAHGAMTTPVAVDLVLQACDAIVEAHSLGIVHRDIKPSNLFVSFRPDQSAIVKVLDFGISKSASGPDLSLTQTQSMLGTPAYMSPEQMRSARSVDQRTDIWSIGTVLYELVEARLPFQAGSFSEMCVMVAIDPPAPMANAGELEAIILRCLSKQPADRYAHVADLMRELAAFAGNPEAATHYVKRAYRTLGLGVPATLESSPNIPWPRQATPLPTPSAVHDAASAAMAASGLNAVPAPTISPNGPTLQDPVPHAPRRSRRLVVGMVLAAVISVAAAIAIVLTTRESTPSAGSATHVATPGSAADGSAEPTGSAGSSRAAIDDLGSTAGSSAGSAAGDGSAVANTGSGSAGSAEGSAVTGAGSGSAVTGAGSGSAATVAGKPPTTRPTTRPGSRPGGKPGTRPPITKPPVTNPPVVTPPVTKPKCDPFASAHPCKS